jgi:hypothetical protein
VVDVPDESEEEEEERATVRKCPANTFTSQGEASVRGSEGRVQLPKPGRRGSGPKKQKHPRQVRCCSSGSQIMSLTCGLYYMALSAAQKTASRELARVQPAPPHV